MRADCGASTGDEPELSTDSVEGGEGGIELVGGVGGGDDGSQARLVDGDGREDDGLGEDALLDESIRNAEQRRPARLIEIEATGVIAGADYFLQRFRFMQRNRMSKQEIKEEYRQNEGDPTIKAKIRQLRHERAKKRMMAAVPTATVVIRRTTSAAR